MTITPGQQYHPGGEFEQQTTPYQSSPGGMIMSRQSPYEQNNSRQPPSPSSGQYNNNPMSPPGQQQYTNQAPYATPAWGNASPGGSGSTPLRQHHPHDGSLQRRVVSGNNGSPQGGGGGGQQVVVDFDGLPLGSLANPIPWDDHKFNDNNDGGSEMRDDHQDNNHRGGEPTSKLTKSKSKTKLTKNKSKTGQQQPTVIPAISVRYNQALLTSQHDCLNSPPKVAIHKTNAILSSDKYVHFYSFSQTNNSCVQTTTV